MQTFVGEENVTARPTSGTNGAAGPGICPPDCNRPIRMRMSLRDTHQMRDLLVEARGSAASAALHDALWLRAVLLEYSRKLGGAQRARFELRADSILSRLSADLGSDVPSEATLTVVRDGKP
jgi:hypothetical protein